MLNRIVAIILSVSLIASVPLASAQETGKSVTRGPRKHLTVILFSGLAGAILGLSTLSFYGRPQERLSNIAVGFAMGVIGGTMYSTYKAATEPRDFYSASAFDVLEPPWSNTRFVEPPAPRFTFQFEF